VLIGKFNAGLSGFTMTHGDIGGYFTDEARGFTRSQDLLMRWIEYSAFADIVMRSNPSNLPESEQIWSD
jgi:alpha-glucosidase (family GH31 glycosyl hydrolase)